MRTGSASRSSARADTLFRRRRIPSPAPGGRPFDILTKQGTLASIPDRVALNGILTMLMQHHKAAQ